MTAGDLRLLDVDKDCFCCRYFQFILGFLMADIAREAVVGLQRKLHDLEKQGKFARERATVAR